MRAVRVCRARSWPASLATGLLRLTQQSTDVAFAAKTALRQFADGDLLRRPG